MKFSARFFVFSSLLALAFAELNLETIQLIFRHGARTPLANEEVVLNFDDPRTYEPWGYGQLIDVGMEQLFQFGRFLRGRYGEFLGIYNENDVFARSTSTNRTIQSLKCLFAGLYLPKDPESIKNVISTLEIDNFSFEVIPKEEDVVLKSQNCRMFIDAVKKVVESDKFQDELSRKFSSTLKLVEKIVNPLVNDKFQPIRSNALTRLAYNVFSSHKALNIPLPDWCNESVFRGIEETSSFSLGAMSATTELRKWNVGPLLKEMLKNVNSKNPRRIYLYSCHDLNLSGLIGSLEFDNFKFPGFGSAIILETWHDAANKTAKFFTLKGWNGTGSDTFGLKLKNCSELCPKTDFETILKPIIPSQEELEMLKKNMSNYVPDLVPVF